MRFPKAPVINETYDYSKFSLLNFNRSIDLHNYNKLLLETEKEFQMQKFPIIVSEKFEIIDGQHRFAVCSNMGAPIYYIFDNKKTASFEDVHSVNRAGKNHTIRDKIEMLMKTGNKAAEQVYSVHSQFDEMFNLSVVASIVLSGNDSGNNKSKMDNTKEIQETELKRAVAIFHAAHNLKIKERYSGRIPYAISIIAGRNKIGPLELVSKINDNLSKWTNPKTRTETVESMLLCYNYNLTKKNRIS